MFDLGLLYAIVAGVALMVNLIILNRVQATKYKEAIDKGLVKLLTFFAFFCLADMIWGMLSSDVLPKNRMAYIISTYAFHLGAAFSAYVWAGCIINYLKVEGVARIILQSFRRVFIIIQVAVLISNIWTGIFFKINENAEYEVYFFRNYMFFIQFAYYVILIIFSGYRLIFKKVKEQRNQYSSAVLFSLVPFAFGVGQMFWPDGPMYSLGFMVTAIVIYSFTITTERESYISKLYKKENNKLSSVIRGLSDDFLVVYYVDMDTSKYEILSNYDEYGNVTAETDELVKDFFVTGLSEIKKISFRTDYEILEKNLNKEHILEELSSVKSFKFSYRLKIDGEVRYCLVKVIRSQADSNEILIGFFDDNERIQEEVRQKEILQNAIDAAEKANRAKTDFLFNMSHDIRTPMNAIIGFTNMAQKHIDEKEYLSQCLDKVRFSSDHLLALINDVLDMSRIESNKLEIRLSTESVTEMTEHVFNVMATSASDRSINFTHEYIGIPCEFVECDALRTNQILLNILSNAIKYTEIGGKVEWIIEGKQNEDPSKIDMCFTVKDTGIGMSPEFVGKIFDEFEREESATISGIEGTGLGMSIVKRLVDMMDGRIEIESEKNRGTCVKVYVTFNKSDESKINQKISVPEKIPMDPESKRILLVDDNNLNREIAKDILEDAGLMVDEAMDGAEAVKMFEKAEAGYYDAILMDVQMPLMNGYEATRRIRSLGTFEASSIPVIAMTANAFEEDKKDAIDAGMNDHLAKPVDEEKLLNTLSKYMKING